MRWLIAGLALMQLAIPLAYIAAGEARINAFLTNDDTYYYLQTAWNARHLGFVTFDGINATNGVQFLWFCVLYGLAFLSGDKSTFLALASTAAIVLTCAPYAVMWRLSGDNSRRREALLGVFMALWWFLICAYPPNQYLSGLESPLHASIIWLIVLQYIRIYRRLSIGPVRSSSALFLVVLLILNTWTRLDSFGLSASFLVLLLLTIDGPLHPVSPSVSFTRSLPLATYIAGALVVAAGTVTLFAFFWLAGGSLMPVSAIVKGHQVNRLSLGAFYNWSLVLFPLRIQGANLLNILGILAMFGSMWKLIGMRVASGDRAIAVLRLVAITLGASVLVHSIATFGMFRYYYFWYLSASFTYWTIALALFGVELVERRAWGHRMTAVLGAAVAVPVVCLWWLREPPNNLAATRYEAGKWIDANVEADAVVGSFNAGQLGYFSNRSVVNLDGLINNVRYFENVLRTQSPAALSAYMDQVGIDYLADHIVGTTWRPLIERQFITIQEFRLASGGSVRVMKRVR